MLGPLSDRSQSARRAFRGLAARLAVCLALAAPGFERPALADAAPAVAPAPAEPGDDAEALIAALRARILAARSATLALEGWCADQRLAADPHLVAVRLPGPDKPLTAAQRARLMIASDEPVRYRRVRLSCGDRVVSEADNWYVPARLTPAMNESLETTRTPFGRVVRPLDPVRRTIAERALHERGRVGADDPLFAIDALLLTGAGEPFCEVSETYLGGALPSGAR